MDAAIGVIRKIILAAEMIRTAAEMIKVAAEMITIEAEITVNGIAQRRSREPGKIK